MLVNINLDQKKPTEKKAVQAVERYKAAEIALKEAEFKCHKLVKFRQDYVDLFHKELKHCVAEETQQGFRSFFSRLDEVIFEQQDIVATLQRTVNTQRELAEACQKKVQLMGTEEAVC